jgi:hypothetical protein
MFYTNLVTITSMIGSHKNRRSLAPQGIGGFSFGLVYAGFYTSLMDQGFSPFLKH